MDKEQQAADKIYTKSHFGKNGNCPTSSFQETFDIETDSEDLVQDAFFIVALSLRGKHKGHSRQPRQDGCIRSAGTIAINALKKNKSFKKTLLKKTLQLTGKQ